MSGATLFWWEDGYDKAASDAALAEQLVKKRTVTYDCCGDNYLLHINVTDLHHLFGGFLVNNNTFVSLNEPGKGRHQKNSSVSFYAVRNNHLVLERSFKVGDNSGYFAISNDNKFMAIGVLKVDVVMVFEIDTGDLLLELQGGL